MAGIYTPKSGNYAGKAFTSYRQYLNQKAADEGYRNFNDRTQARAEQRTIEEIQFDETVERRNSNVKIDIYRSDNLSDILHFASLLPPKYAVRVIVDIDNAIGSSKSKRNVRGYSTIVKTVKVSLFKKELENGKLQAQLELDLSEVEHIYGVVLWVYR